MKKSRFTESQIIAVLKEGEAGVPVGEIVRKHGISKISTLEGSNVAQFPVPIYTPGGDSNARK